jgi:nuclear pore complex protein Nup133
MELMNPGLFDKDSALHPLSPEQIIGACTDELDHRFSGLDVSIRETIMKDFQAEDKAFQVYMEKSQLEKWHTGALDLARQDHIEEVGQDTKGGLKMGQAKHALAEAERNITKREKENAQQMLHSNKPQYRPKASILNGSTRSFRGSIKQY